MKSFEEMNLPESLLLALKKIKFIEPTPIQAEAVPVALEGKDILGTAQTGTGKTGAFGIPLIAKVLSSSKGSALVVTPTRELATQVMKQLQTILGRNSKVRTALLIGGEAIPRQFRQLRNNPRVIVGTPGRINDHLNRESLSLSDADFLVLDETDRMLDMGFTPQIENIVSNMAPERQTLLFSATLPSNILGVAKKYMTDPVRIAVDTKENKPAANIKQDTLRVNQSEKYPELISQLKEREGSVIIFMKTKHSTEKMADKLSKEGYSADAIHGDLRQSKRERVIASFRKKKYRILVATDVAARGLDIPHIEHVINYDLPQCAEDYVHRIGRTARAGAKGFALNLITPSDMGKWKGINTFLTTGKQEERPAKGSRKRRSNGGRSSFSDRRSNGDSKASFGGRRSGSEGGRRRSEGSSSFGERRRSSERGSSFGERRGASEGASFGERRRSSEGGSSFGGRRRSEGNAGFGDRRRSSGNEGGSSFGGRRRSEGNTSFGERRRSEGNTSFSERRRAGSDSSRDGNSTFSGRRRSSSNDSKPTIVRAKSNGRPGNGNRANRSKSNADFSPAGRGKKFGNSRVGQNAGSRRGRA